MPRFGSPGIGLGPLPSRLGVIDPGDYMEMSDESGGILVRRFSFSEQIFVIPSYGGMPSHSKV